MRPSLLIAILRTLSILPTAPADAGGDSWIVRVRGARVDNDLDFAPLAISVGLGFRF